MSHSEKNQARRLSEYVDSIITRSRAEESGPCDNDPSLGELAHLAADLSDLRFVMPEALHQDVSQRILRDANKTQTKDHSHVFRVLMQLKRGGVGLHVPVGLACTFVLVLAAWFWKASPVSAATVLARSEAALANLMGPDEILHRGWRVSVESTCPAGGNLPVQTGIIDEWLETGGQVRSAGRSTRSNGALRWAYTTGGTQNRHIVYFPPSSSNPHGLLSIEPTTDEYYAAIQSFPADRQPVIRAYLDRGYLVEPVLSDQRFNWRAITDQSNKVDKLPQIILTMEEGVHKNGDVYYRVSIAEDRRPHFWWSAQGKPEVWLEHQVSVRFISAKTYLSWRIETSREDDRGCRMTTVRDLIADERVAKKGTGSDVFALTVPKDTLVRRQSAAELLEAVLEVLDHKGNTGPRHSLE